ncbi:MAG TPA: ribokinase [Ilumatobacter sp.]|nr:ribokinase [Ilumatobacter sp.]
MIGSANLDVVARCARHPLPGETLLGSSLAEHAGGKGLNQAVAAARSGARTVLVGAVGNDAAGVSLREVLTADGIDSSYVAVRNGATGRAIIVVDDAGENTIVVIPGANQTVEVPSELPRCRVAVAQLEVPMRTVIAAFAAARALGAKTVLNPAPAVDLPAELLELSDVVVPNQHELELLGGAEHLLNLGVRALVVTLGASGVDVITAAGRTHVDPFPVDVVDTTGAGDAFCGALCARLASGHDLHDAVRWGAAAGALATTVTGAVPAQPTAEAIQSLLDVT